MLSLANGIEEKVWIQVFLYIGAWTEGAIMMYKIWVNILI